jgi:hypothetical protein
MVEWLAEALAQCCSVGETLDRARAKRVEICLHMRDHYLEWPRKFLKQRRRCQHDVAVPDSLLGIRMKCRFVPFGCQILLTSSRNAYLRASIGFVAEARRAGM